MEGTKLLKELYSGKQSKSQSPRVMVSNAFSIYHRIKGRKNKFVLNTFLKLLFECKECHQIGRIWGDIERADQMALVLLLKVCVQSKPMSIWRCILILKWIKDRKYRLKHYEIADFSINASKLISVSSSNYKDLQRIHVLVEEHDDIFIKTALIHSFGKCGDVETAENVFGSVEGTQRNTVCLNAMLTAYLNNARFENVLSLYAEHQGATTDDTSHLLAIKACTKTADLVKGKEIHKRTEPNIISITFTDRKDIDLVNA